LNNADGAWLRASISPADLRRVAKGLLCLAEKREQGIGKIERLKNRIDALDEADRLRRRAAIYLGEAERLIEGTQSGFTTEAQKTLRKNDETN